MVERLLFWLWLNSIKGIGPGTAKLLLDRFQEPEVISILTINDALYPSAAKEIDKAPIVLYYRGTIAESSIGVAIVGSRRCTEYGKLEMEQ
jgi:DNA processing protein